MGRWVERVATVSGSDGTSLAVGNIMWVWIWYALRHELLQCFRHTRSSIHFLTHSSCIPRHVIEILHDKGCTYGVSVCMEYAVALPDTGYVRYIQLTSQSIISSVRLWPFWMCSKFRTLQRVSLYRVLPLLGLATCCLPSKLCAGVKNSQNDTKSGMTPSMMHPKQSTIVPIIHRIVNMLEFMIRIALNSRLATSFILKVTRRRA